MLKKAQLESLRKHLEDAQNPVFYYDNDADGLCSFLLLRRYLGRGKGVAIRSYPDLNSQYARKALELNADYVFVLDKPVISREFFEEISKAGLPLVWIDHHDVPESKIALDFSNVQIFNPALDSSKEKSEEPTTYLCYSLTKRKQDLWIALIGCIADHFLPDFAEEFAQTNPESWGDVKEPFDALFDTEIGKIAQSFNFGLKDSTSNILAFQNYLIECKSYLDVFSENGANYNFRKKVSYIKSKYEELIFKARKQLYENVLFFIYGGDLSISAEISNQLSHEFKDKYIAVCYKRGSTVNVSLRGKNVKKILEEFLILSPGSQGGGHDDAAGARISSQEVEKLKELLINRSSLKKD